MTPDKKAIGARLRKAREDSPYWSRPDLARLLRGAAEPRDRDRMPHVPSLTEMIKQWETGKYVPNRRYRALYVRVTGRADEDLFGSPRPELHLWRPDGLDGTVTPEDEDRLTQVSLRPARLDVATLDALAAVLAGQRRLEDAMGPAVLLDPVAGQLDAITHMLRDAHGPLRDQLGRIVAEWTAFTGWLHAALRLDARAIALFHRAVDLADEFDHGTVAALGTSFTGYVARQQNRPRAVVRASAAALATPGAHPAQRLFDRLQSARAHAMLGDDERARRILLDVADHADEVADPPPPIYWYSPPFFRLVVGITFSSLGDHEDAAALVAEGKAGLPVDQQGAEWVNEFDEILARDRCEDAPSGVEG
ncbi:transcriptional regulator [Actinomadura litoris]|uniref:Transcriptional regulator n=1 Tax=Actinomadura litoris TaxID=2678616 RepID=A0A7K1L3I6_9ACTN|nr:transcriptional regulator [Actinomadura litoris]MUN38994.1 transcriptional regulator [Actinomadura litoris]